MGTCKRKDGQDTKEELQKRNLRDELEERERRHFSSKDKSYIGRETIEIVENEATFYWKVRARRDAEDRLIPHSVDADDADVELKSGHGMTMTMMKMMRMTQKLFCLNFEQIKKERAEEKHHNNWWDDDVVFKNQARGESKAPKRFINDTIRNDFHRKFLHKYMK
ncbi:unnamed protein product [Camellia sinensis]